MWRSVGAAGVALALGTILMSCRPAWAADTPIVLSRNGRTVAIEPYAPNIVRITLSTERSAALAQPGYGISGAPSMKGWSTNRYQ